MDNNNIIKIFLFTIPNFFLYIILIVLIIRNHKLSPLSIRSPYLLALNLVFLFLTQTFLFIGNYNNNTIIRNLFFFFQAYTFITFIIRYLRIFFCINISSISNDKQYFENKKQRYTEKYYFKILVIILIAITVILIIIKFICKFDYFIICSPKLLEDIDQYNKSLILWMALNFIELIVLSTIITLLYMCKFQLKYFVQSELIIFIILWFACYCGISICGLHYLNNKAEKLNDHLLLILILFYYGILILIGIIPLIISTFSSMNFAYFFTSGLTDNFFLFLSNEVCYKAFLDFIHQSQKEVYFLKIYTHIMKYRFEYMMDQHGMNLPNSLNQVVQLYFSEENEEVLRNIDSELVIIAQKVRASYSREINSNNPECLNEALEFVCRKLLLLFHDYKTTVDFEYLIKNLKLNSYIQCKMCNVGLLNKH